MKRVVLFYPTHRFGEAIHPRLQLPLSLLSIGTPLDRAGYNVEIVDQRVDEAWKEKLTAAIGKRPICLGITSMTGPQIKHGLEASRMARQQGDVPVVWGGIHPTLLPRQTLENENIDIVVEGEGEETFFELVQALERGRPLKEVKGIWYKENGEIINTEPRPFVDLNKVPPLSYHLVDVKKYLYEAHGVGHLALETSRGCPFRCTYCYNTNVYRSKWRGLTAEETVRRIKILVKDFGIEGITFADDNFFGNKRRGLEILERLKEERLGITCSKLDAHISLLSRLTDEELRLMSESGCRMVMVGVESGSPRILKMLKKELSVSDILEFNKRLLNFDIMPLYFFMVGYPTETLAELSETISLYLRLLRGRSDVVCHLNIYTPFPGTELFDIAVRNGLRVPEKLEEWVSFNFQNVNNRAPWLSEKRKKIIQMLHFTALFTDKTTFVKPYKKTHPLVVSLAKLYHPIAKKRFEKLYYRFPIEIKLVQWLGLYSRQVG